MSRRPFDPLPSFPFLIELEGVAAAGFKACDGLQVSIDVISHASGDDKALHARKLPGRVHAHNIVLRRGLTVDGALWDWFKATAEGELQRRSGSVIVLNEKREEALRYNFYEAWPCRWKSLELDASRSGSLIEELELAVEKIERA